MNTAAAMVTMDSFNLSVVRLEYCTFNGRILEILREKKGISRRQFCGLMGEDWNVKRLYRYERQQETPKVTSDELDKILIILKGSEL